jgi:protein-S-isoprenylcysteine O-methyltransferase Ste14
MLSSKRSSPWLFFALAYGWSWLFWVSAALSRLEFDEPPVPILIALVGVALVPLWWFGLLILITIEEESLERSLGQSYLEYKKRVRGRIIPGLPI